MGCHAHDRTNGNDARATDAGYHHAHITVIDSGYVRCRQLAKQVAVQGDSAGLFGLRVQHGNEGWAEALHAAVVLVATGLVDLALGAEFGFPGLY